MDDIAVGILAPILFPGWVNSNERHWETSGEPRRLHYCVRRLTADERCTYSWIMTTSRTRLMACALSGALTSGPGAPLYWPPLDNKELLRDSTIRNSSAGDPFQAQLGLGFAF